MNRALLSFKPVYQTGQITNKTNLEAPWKTILGHCHSLSTLNVTIGALGDVSIAYEDRGGSTAPSQDTISYSDSAAVVYNAISTSQLVFATEVSGTASEATGVLDAEAIPVRMFPMSGEMKVDASCFPQFRTWQNFTMPVGPDVSAGTTLYQGAVTSSGQVSSDWQTTNNAMAATEAASNTLAFTDPTNYEWPLENLATTQTVEVVALAGALANTSYTTNAAIIPSAEIVRARIVNDSNTDDHDMKIQLSTASMLDQQLVRVDLEFATTSTALEVDATLEIQGLGFVFYKKVRGYEFADYLYTRRYQFSLLKRDGNIRVIR